MSPKMTVATAAALTTLGGLLFAPVASAAPPQTVTQLDASLECTGTTTSGDPVRVSTGTSAQFGDNLFASVGPEDAPKATAFGVDGGWDGATISFTLEVFEGSGGGHRTLAPGSFTATTRVTSTSEHTIRDGSGNQHLKGTIVTSTLSADATLTLPGFTIRDLECTGSSTASTLVTNTPASTVTFERQFFDRERCDGNAVVGLFGPVDGEYFLSVEVGEANNQLNLFGVVPEPKGDSFEVTLPLRNSQTAEVLGQFKVAVTLTATQKPTKTLLRTAIARITQERTLYDVHASATIPGMQIDSTCQTLEVDTRSVIRASNGPKPTDVRPPNDSISGARPIAIGDTIRATTRGAAVESEADIACAPAPGRTLWYSFVGTGQPVRIDTAGSSFDTALATYRVASGGRLRPVACNDNGDQDFPLPTTTLQARLGMPTVAGRTYYLQVGGVFADFGRLVMTIK
jgi:hypothetical protein